MINELFDVLDEWRQLPAYQLERRADIFFAIHLGRIFESIFHLNVVDIIPELPIHIGTINPNRHTNKSDKVDYAVFTDSGKVFLVELKTDDKSIRGTQYDYYFKAIARRYENILQGIITIFEASRSQSKYTQLLRKLVANGSLKKRDNGQYVTTNKYTFHNTPIFIKPNQCDTDQGKVIDFQRIIRILESDKDELTKRFVISLKKWISPV